MTSVELTLIGGYLGAGKTTLLNRMLSQARHRFAVIVNDLGALPIDQALIESTSGTSLTLTNGCACCQLGGDLASQIDQLAQTGFERVLIEASGVAKMSRLRDQLVGLPGVTLRAAMTLIDGQSLASLLCSRWVDRLIRDQLDHADLIIATRVMPSWSSEQVAWRERAVFLEASGELPDWVWQVQSQVSTPGFAAVTKPEFHHRAVVVRRGLSRADFEGFVAAHPQIQRAKGFATLNEGHFLVQSTVGRCILTPSPAQDFEGVQFIWVGDELPPFAELSMDQGEPVAEVESVGI
ncbi:MAG: CobW family GTP-binding protein [Pseudomonadales bacterium]|jgi:hypothetical protein